MILSGALSYAEEGVLEQVAETRMRHGWMEERDLDNYDVLLGVVNCDYVGSEALLVIEYRFVYRALIVDCAGPDNKMIQNGLLADINNENLVHKQARLFIKRN